LGEDTETCVEEIETLALPTGSALPQAKTAKMEGHKALETTFQHLHPLRL
jgi:hypothetical protein